MDSPELEEKSMSNNMNNFTVFKRPSDHHNTPSKRLKRDSSPEIVELD